VAETLSWNLERHRPMLRLHAQMLRLHPRILVKFGYSELVNETLLVAHERFAQFEGSTEAQLIAWLKRILTNRARDKIDYWHAEIRDIDRECPIEAASEDSSQRLGEFLAAQNSSPSEHVSKEEQLARLARALDELDQDQREAIVARYLMQLPVAEIASQMKRSERSVAGLLLRGRKRLRNLLKEDSDEGDADERK
jgi:RNA polymerase sigma-70 factor, ECF subfamily